jgi:hypothetical protein
MTAITMHTTDCPGRVNGPAACTCGGKKYTYTSGEAIVLAPGTPREPGAASDPCKKEFKTRKGLLRCVRKNNHSPPHHVLDPESTSG